MSCGETIDFTVFQKIHAIHLPSQHFLYFLSFLSIDTVCFIKICILYTNLILNLFIVPHI